MASLKYIYFVYFTRGGVGFTFECVKFPLYDKDFVLPPRLKRELYLFLQNNLLDVFEELSVTIRQNTYFMNDGVPPHFSVGIGDHLNNVFPNC